MITTAFVVSACIVIISVFGYNRTESADGRFGYTTLGWIFAFASLAFFVWMLVLMNSVGDYNSIVPKIEAYEEENTQIEQFIDVILREKMEYGYEKREGTEGASSPLLVDALYPELKEIDMVNKKISTYINNEAAIRELKLNRASISKDRWLLYFGS